MARKDTNKQYSLRKLKTGTASVAVAVAVLGAGFANQTTVKADNPSSVPVKKAAELYDKIKELEEGREELLNDLDKVKEEHKKDHEKLEKKAEDVERHYLRQLDQDHKEQQERQKNLEELERQSQREVEKRYQEQLQKQQQLETEKQISEASRKSLSRDLEAS
ncbi:TPA: YSIRK-type signal peptide-containing protein, partial [Streptococcus pyogenes]|nr:YSIRK-type signal peptide-containing protein [Streptococcus pyogenes]